MSQGDLFAELASKMTDPVVGLRVKLRPCRKCGCAIALIVRGEWLVTPLCCEQCGLERGRLSYAAFNFIRKAVGIWGRPTSPIELKDKDQSYIETSSQPPGAGVEMQSHAPTNADNSSAET